MVVGATDVVVYLIEAACGMRGLRHSSEADPNTSQVNVTRSPGHVNHPCLLEASSTLSAKRKMIKWQYCKNACYIHMFCYVESVKLHHYFTFGDISTDYDAVHSIDTLRILCIQQIK